MLLGDRHRQSSPPLSATLASSSSPLSQAARAKALFPRPREGEKEKFRRDGKTDEKHSISYGGDDIMGLVERDHMALMPAVFSTHGHAGPLFHRRVYGHDAAPHPTFENRPHAPHL